MDPFALTVYESPFSKVRLGKNNDGGFIIANIPNITYSLAISAGSAVETLFEQEFLKNYTNTKCIIFDDGIDKLSNNNNPNIEFVKKNIGTQNTKTTTNLHGLIDSNSNLFLKMDIEGREIPWIKTLREDQLNKFNQVVIEFHNPFSNNEVDVFEKMNKNFYLVHFHPNNCCGTRNHKGFVIPNIFECTYVNKKYFTSPLILNTQRIPSSLDMRNLADRNEICIDYRPFVWTPGRYSMDDISVYIFNWKRVSSNSLILYNKIKEILPNVTIINCDENLSLGSIRHIQLDDSHYYGSQFNHAIRDVNPNSICCMIVGDNVNDNNFSRVFCSALEAFNANQNLGVYAPNDRRSMHADRLEHINGPLYNVVNTDCGFWFVSPTIISIVKGFDFSISKYGWGIDCILIGEARKRDLLVCRDYSTETNQLDHSCYYDKEAAAICWSLMEKKYDEWLKNK